MTSGVSDGAEVPVAVADAVVEVRGACADYDSIRALHHVSMRVAPHRVHAVLGANGAGKTTLLNVIAGVHQPAEGDVLLAGVRTNGFDPVEVVSRGLCLIPEGRGVFPNLTVNEHLWLLAPTRAHRAEVEESTFSRFPRLGERRRQLAGSLSGGEQQMLALSRALATDPAILLLDELSQGLAPAIVENLYELIATLAEEDMTIVVVEQFARIALSVAHTATVLAQGRVVLDGVAAEIEHLVTEAYLGG